MSLNTIINHPLIGTRVFKKISCAVKVFLLLLILLPFLGNQKAEAQTKEYATWAPNHGSIRIGLFGSGSVDDPENAATTDENTFATLKSNRAVLGASGGDGWIQLKFPTPLEANSTVYVRVSDFTQTGLSINLGDLLGASGDFIKSSFYKGATAGNNNNNEGTEISNISVESEFLYGSDGGLYLAIRSPNNSESFNSVRLRLTYKGGLNLDLASTMALNIHHAIAYDNTITCESAMFAGTGRTTGINISLGDAIKNPEQAIDGNPNTHSSISFGALSINVASSIFQDFYFNGLSEPQDYFKVKLKLGGGALDLDVLGNYEVRAYNKDELVYTKKLQGALVNGLDILGLLQSGNPVEIPFGPGVPFDRVAIGINAAIGASLASSPLEVYSVERYGLGDSPLCKEANPPLEDEGGEHMLGENRECADILVGHEYTNFPHNAVDGNNGTFAVLEATSGSLLGAGAYSGNIELGYQGNVAANTTSYLKIDMEDEGLLSGLLDGSLGELLNGVVDNLLFGNHYFTIQVNDENGNPVLEGSSEDAFNGLPIKVVQDKYGHYYVAITPGSAYRSVKITEHFPSLVGAEASRTMKVYGLCYSTGSEECEQAFSTYFESNGIDLSILEAGDGGVTNAHLAIDDDHESVEDDETYSEIKLGGLGVELAASSFQHVNFHTLSDPSDYFKIKLGIDNPSTLNVDLLNNIEIRAYNGDDLVYSQRLQNGLVAGLDILGLLQTEGAITLPIGPGVAFDRVAVGINKLAGVSLFNNPLKVYSIKRFGNDCPDPNPIVPLPNTDSPFNAPVCAGELGEFGGANFPYNAVDGMDNTYASITSESGFLLGAGASEGSIELKFDDQNGAKAGEVSYVKIGFEEEGLLGSLLGGSLGDILSTVGDVALFGDKYFDIEVRKANGSAIYDLSGVNGFTSDLARIVQDKYGHFYLAFTAEEDYQSIKITLKYPAIAGLGASTSMQIFGMCREGEFDDCEQAAFTTFDGSGLNLNLFEDANPAGVVNPQYAIDDNTSNYTELSLGTAAIGSTIHQDIFFKTKSDAKLKLRLQIPETLVNADLLGAYKVYLFNGSEEVGEVTLQNSLVNNLDLLGLFKSGGVVGIEIDEGVEYDRVRLELGSAVNVSIGNPVRFYGAYRISDDCPDPTFEESPFESCGTELVSANNVDDVQNLLDDNHNSYATLRSDAGLILDLGSSEAHVELAYPNEIDGNETSYIRIDYDESILENLLKGSLGGFVTGILDNLLLGDHYFDIEVKNADDNSVVSRSSRNGFVNEQNEIDDIVRLVQDTKGRFYLAIKPGSDYKSIRITDKTNAIIGLTSQDKYLNIYGMCYGITEEDCPSPFSTSQQGSGITLDALNSGGAGVQDAFWAIDENLQSASTLSLGNAAIGGTLQQNVQFGQVITANTPIRISLSANGGDVSLGVASNIEIIAFKDGAEIDSKNIEQALVGLNLLDLVNNGAAEEFVYTTTEDIDEIAIRLTSAIGVGVTPAISLYYVLPDCTVPQFTAWKSFEINGDPILTSVSGGEEVEYTIHVRNTGQVDIEDFSIIDTIPENTTFVESTEGTENSGVLSFTGVDVPVGETATVSFTVEVNENLTDVTEITNVAFVKEDANDEGTETFPPSETDPDEPDDSGETGTLIPVDQDNSLVSWKAYKVDDDPSITSVSGGETIEYTIYVRNTGNQDLTNVVVSDVLPEGVAYESGGDLTGNTVSFTINELPVGETSDPLVFTVTVKDDLTGVNVIRNVATVVSDEVTTPEESYPPTDNENPTDPEDSGETGTEIDVEPDPSLISWKAYEVKGDPSITSVSGGETIEYTIFVRNTGNQALSDVEITDELPDGVTHVSGGTLNGNTVSFTIPSLAVGATSAGQIFTVEVEDDLTGIDVIRNVAVVEADGVPPTESYPPADNENPDDPDDTGDTGTDIPVDASHSVEFSKTGESDGANNGQAVAGDIITYTLSVKNTGNKALTDLVITDDIPDNTTLVDAGDFTQNGTTLEHTLSALDVGQTATLAFEVEVDAIDPNSVESIDNTAEITFRNEDDSGDVTETAGHTMPTDCTPVEANNITLSADVAEVCAGEEVILTAGLDGISITDPIFLWYDNAALNGNPIVIGDNATFTPEETTTYYVVVAAEGYCFNTPAASIEVTVEPLPETPTITLTGDASICEGETVELTATAGAEAYIWYLDGVVQSETSNTFEATEPGVYTVAAENTAGCASAESAAVTVEVTPTATEADIDVTGNDDEICEGEQVVLSASSTTVTDPVFNWYSDAALTDLIFTGPELTFNPSENTTVYVTVQGDEVCENPSGAAKEVEVTVNPTPEYTIDGSLSHSIEVDNAVTLPEITAPNADIAWYDNNGNAHTGSETETFDTPGTYTYTAVISEDDHCTVSVSVVINVYAEGECPPVYDRVYATDGSDYGVSNLLGIPLGSVSEASSAADGDLKTHSVLTEGANALGLLGQTYQTLKWSDPVTAGTPVSVKLGKAFSTANVLGSLRVVAVDAGGNAVGTVQNVESKILEAAGGLNVYEYTFTPTDGNGQGVAYSGVKVYFQGAVSLGQTAHVYDAYYHEAGAVDCGDDEVLDVLHGVENPISGLGVGNVLIGVEDAENVIDGDDDTYAVMNNVVAVNAQTRLEVLYNTPALAGDEVHIKLSDPNSLLAVQALQSFKIQPYLGNAPVGEPIDESSSILNIELLTGGSEANVTYTADRSFDRIKILYGGVTGVLDQLRVHEITRTVPQLELGDNKDNVFEICEGEDITIPDPDDCTSYIIYTDATGTEVADITELDSGSHALYVQTVRFGTCEVGERTEIEVNVNALPEIDEQPQDMTVAAGGDAELTVTLVDETLEVSYQWEVEDGTDNWIPVSDVTSDEATLTIPVPADQVEGELGNYRVVIVSDDGGCEVISLPAIITVVKDYGFDDGAISKVGQNGNENAVAGDEYTYTVTVENRGPSTILDGTTLYFQDVVSGGQTLTEVNYEGTAITPDSDGLFSLDVSGDVDADDTFTFDVEVDVSSDAPSAINNTIHIWADDPGTDLDNPDGTATTPDIDVDRDYGFDNDAISKVGQNGNENAVAGDEYTYTVTVENRGPSTILDGTTLYFQDVVSNGQTLTEVNYEGTAITPDSDGLFSLDVAGDIAVNQTITFDVEVDVSSDAPSIINNTIHIWADDPGTDLDTPDGTAETPDIDVDRDYGFDNGAISKVGQNGNENAVAGDEYTYTVTVENQGPSTILDGTTLYFQDVVSGGQTLTEVNYEGTAITPDSDGLFSLDISGDVDAGDTFTFDVEVDVSSDAPSTINNTIHIWADDPGTDLDTPDGTATTPDIDVDRDYGFDDDAISKVGQNGNENAVAGDGYTYTVTVENQGPSTILDGTTLYFQDVVSNGQDIVEITSNKGTVSTVGAAGEFALEVTTAVAPNETFTLTVEVDVSSDAPSTINNTIHIWADDPGTDLDTPDGTATTPDIDVDRDYGFDNDAISKVGQNGNENAVAGDGYTYTVTVENQGPSTILDGTTLYFQDVVSNGQDIVEITSNKGTVSTVGAAGEFALEVTTAVAPNETFTLTVEVDVSSDAPSAINNTIHIWADDPGTDLDNPDGTATTPDIDVDRDYGFDDGAISKSGQNGNENAVAGDEYTYTVTVENRGPSTILDGTTLYFQDVVSNGQTLTEVNYEGTAITPDSDGLFSLDVVGDIAVNQTITFDVEVDVSSDAPSAINNTIHIWADDPGTDLDTPDGTAETPDIDVDRDYGFDDDAISKVGQNGNENAVAGDEYTYTVTVENQGPSTILDGTTLYFQDVVSNGQDIVEITSNKGTVSTVGAAGEFALEVTTAVAPNETFTLTVEVDVSSDAPSTINNTIHIWADDPGTDLDNPDGTGETPDIDVDKDYGLGEDGALIKVAKEGEDAVAIAGEEFEYTITLTNKGKSTIKEGTELYFQDELSDGQDLIDISSSNGQVSTPDEIGAFLLTVENAVEPGDNLTLSVTVGVPANTEVTTVDNTIRVWTEDPGTDPKDPEGEDKTPPYTVDRVAKFGVVKTTDAVTAVAGESVDFSVVLTNKGPSTAKSGHAIVVTEKPEGLTISDSDISVTSGNADFDGSYDASTGEFTVVVSDEVAVGGTVELTVTGHVPADASGTVKNGIEVDGDEDETPEIPVDREYGLSITKVADESSVKAGGSTSFTLTITNDGPSAMEAGKAIELGELPGTGVTVTGYDIISGAATVSGSGNSATVTTDGVFAVGGTIEVQVSADIDSDASSTITNGIKVWGPDKDPETDDPDDEDETPEIPVDREYGLSITKVADESSVKAGGSTSFTLTVTNDGPSAMEAGKAIELGELPSTGVTVTGYDIISGAATVSGSGNSATVTTDGVFAVGGTIEVQVSADIDSDAPSTITNGIKVWGPDKDPETDDPDDEDETPEIPVDREYGLSITKVADEASVKAGGSTSFTLTVTNDGPSAMEAGKAIELGELPGTGVTVTGYDIISGAATVSGSGNSATVTTDGVFAVGGTIEVQVSADIDSDAPSAITNGIKVWGPDKDPETDDPDDEDETPEIPVDREYGLSITKVADESSVKAGGSTSFTLTVTNDGPSAMEAGKAIELGELPGTGVTVTGYDIISGAATVSGSGNSTTVTTDGVFAVGGTIEVQVSADIDSDAPSAITNGIKVWGPDKDPETDDPDDEDETPEIPVERPYRISIDKTADEPSVVAGESTSFTLTLTNHGPSTIASGEELTLGEEPSEGVAITGYEVVSGEGTVSGSGNEAVLTTTGAWGVNEEIQVRVTADIASDAPETISNGVSVWGPDKDKEEEPDDKDETPEIPVEYPNLLSIDKVAQDKEVEAGSQTQFTITVTNISEITMEEGEVIRIVDTPDEGLVISDYEVTSGNATYDNSYEELFLTLLSDLEPGQQIVVEITVDVEEDARGMLSNMAAVWSPNNKTDRPDDESTSDPVDVQEPDLTIHIPNVITPNNDGWNDKFVIEGSENYDKVSLTVINRWGGQVYRSDTYNNDWDGAGLNEGTYYYIVEVYKGDQKTVHKGYVLIKRN